MNKILSSFFLCPVALALIVSCQKERAVAVPAYEISTSATVDLGLSVLWSGTNLCADDAAGSGVFIAWGEVAEKQEYTRETYEFWDKTAEAYTLVPGSTVERDVAFETLGRGWQIPTVEQYRELAENTTVKKTTYKGVVGWAVTSKKPGYEGVSIFFPAAGYKAGKNYLHEGVQGIYFTNQLVEGESGRAQNIFFQGDSLIVNDGINGKGTQVYCGLPIRPVYKKTVYKK